MDSSRQWLAGRAGLFLKLVLAGSLAASQSAEDTKLRGVAVDAVSGVEVLDDEDLEASGGALAGGNDGPGKEEFPDLVAVSTLLKAKQFKALSLTLYQR